MTPSFKYLIMLMLPALLGLVSSATPVVDRPVVSDIHSTRDMSPRSTNTCADPTIAQTLFQGFAGTLLAHVIHFHYAFVHADTFESTGPAFWSFQGPVGKAWQTQQPFTSPLFRLTTPTNSDYQFRIGVDASTPPVVSGFVNDGLVGWVYNTSVCDSVPLMTAVAAAKSDHYYTIDPNEHASLLSAGWTDGGIAAYVLPLP